MNTSSLSLLRTGSLWNLAGLLVPIAVAIACIPALIVALGPQRFGGLTLAWTIAGHFSLLDLGLSRALTYAVATRLAKAPGERPSMIINTGMRLISLVGLAMGLLFLLLGPLFVASMATEGSNLKDELLESIYLLAASIPIVVATSGYRGLLEAERRFAAINLIRIPIGSLATVGPLLATFISGTLTSAVAAIVLTRLIGLLAMFLVTTRSSALGTDVQVFAAGEGLALTKYGAWTAVSAVLSPIMTYCDRFIIAVVSLSAVTVYATVFDVMIRLLILPAAIAGAMFPILCNLRFSDPDAMLRVYLKGILYIGVGLSVAAIVLSTSAEPLLTMWIGADFAKEGSPLVPVLALGVLVNGIAHAPYALIHAHARPDLTARLHIIEAPLYLLLLILLLQSHGIVGAAWAWVIRTSFDALALTVVSRFVVR